jgi:hypothetical protein
MRKLTQLSVTKVSLVPRGSNPGAHIAIFKADAPPTPVDNTDTEIRKLVAEFGEYVNTLLDSLKKNELDGDPDVAKQHVQKKAEGIFARLFNQEISMSKSADATPEPAQGQVEPVNLSELPASVQKMIADQQEQIAKANAAAEAASRAADEAIAKVAVETEARERLECEKQADRDIPMLPGTAQERGNLLYDLRKSLPAEAFERTLATMRAGNAAIAAHTVETGLATSTTKSSDSVTAELQAVADEIRKANPGMTNSVALTKAYHARPDLYKQAKAEEEKTGGRRKL